MTIILKEFIIKKSGYLGFLSIILLLISGSEIQSQSLIEQVGGAKTNFIFKSDTTTLDVIDQAITKRGFYDYGINTDMNSAYGYGYGVELYWLEFISPSKFRTNYLIQKKRKEQYYDIRLFDGSDSLILVTRLEMDDIIESSNDSDLKTYSINLQKLPLISLDNSKTIQITIINVRPYK